MKELIMKKNVKLPTEKIDQIKEMGEKIKIEKKEIKGGVQYQISTVPFREDIPPEYLIIYDHRIKKEKECLLEVVKKEKHFYVNLFDSREEPEAYLQVNTLPLCCRLGLKHAQQLTGAIWLFESVARSRSGTAKWEVNLLLYKEPMIYFHRQNFRVWARIWEKGGPGRDITPEEGVILSPIPARIVWQGAVKGLSALPPVVGLGNAEFPKLFYFLNKKEGEDVGYLRVFRKTHPIVGEVDYGEISPANANQINQINQIKLETIKDFNPSVLYFWKSYKQGYYTKGHSLVEMLTIT